MNHLATFLLLTLALLVLGCASAAAQPARVAVIAHRGASEYAPENTLASFALAAEMKAGYFELDCQLSKDGEIFVCHDLTVERTAKGKHTGTVGSLTAAELKSLDAGSWKDPKFAGERLPTLREALELARAKKIGVYIEIKDVNRDAENAEDTRDQPLEDELLKIAGDRVLTREPELAQKALAAIERFNTPNLPLSRKTAALVHELKMEKQVVIQSFSTVDCAVVRLENPDLRVEYLVDHKPKKPEVWKNFLVFARALDVAGCNLGAKAVTRERVQAFHKDHRTVAVWTVNDEPEMRRFVDLGVDAIITNKPGLCVRVLKDLGKH